MPSGKLKATVVQSALHWEDKKANREMLGKKINSITDTELVLLPEMFSTGFTMNAASLAEPMNGETIGWMRNLSAEKKMIIAGSLIIEEEKNFYNRLVWMLPNGKYGTYDKRHLFGYAKENEFYTAGKKRLIASVKGWKIQLLVCYDLRFPVWARQEKKENGEPEFDVLVYVANWPERRSHAWKTLLCARAIENQCYVIGVNRVGDDGNGIHYSGDSMVIDPLGEILYLKNNEEDIFTAELDGAYLEEVRSRFPFLKDGDDFNLTV